MSPVEPRPVVIGTMRLPSTKDTGGLCFLPKMLAAFNSDGANRPPLMAPSAARNERQLQSKVKFMCGFLSMRFANYFSADGVDGVTTIALPTISISESPGIHSTAMQA